MSDYSNESAVEKVKGNEGDEDTFKILEPTGELLEFEFKRVDEGGTKEAEWEMEGRGVFADFGTDGDRGERTVGLELYVMINKSPEWGDEVGGLVVEVLVPGDVPQEVAVSKLVLGTPDLAASFVDDSVLVGVALLFQETRRRSEEMREEGEVHLKVFFEAGKREL